MKKILNILILLILPLTSAGQIIINLEAPSKKERQYEFVVSTIYLMDLYMESIKDEEIHIGWDFIFSEESSQDGSSWQLATERYYPIALEYIMPYLYDHHYNSKILYGLDPEIPIQDYGHILEKYGITTPYIRAEKIMVHKKPSFNDFYNWTQKYFKDEKDTIHLAFD